MVEQINDDAGRDVADIADDSVAESAGADERLTEGEMTALKELTEIEARFKSGANWFYWVAALSLINSVSILSGSDWG